MLLVQGDTFAVQRYDPEGHPAMVHVDGSVILNSSKLNRPRLIAQHIPRPRLVETLRQGGDRPLTLVCAPAGSGKSTVLSEWLAAADWPGAWVSLDERDNDL